MVLQPLPGMSKERFGLRLAFPDGGVGNGVAFVVVEVALFAQGVEDDDGVGVQFERFGQGLKRGLVVAGLAGGGAKALGPQADHGALHDGLVSGVEAVVVAQFGQPGIGQVAPGRGEQALHAGRRRFKGLQAMDRQ